MNPAIELYALSKTYGHVRAVDQLNLTVPSGSIFGILGPNGSGKSTTLGMILSLLKPDEGTIKIFGNSNLDVERKRIGTSLETAMFYPYFSGKKNLMISALNKGTPVEQIDLALQQVGLDDRKYDKFSSYSFGMKQRLSIAAALLGNPEIIILDEPTNGLDPLGIVEIRNLILELSRSGKTVLVASHLLNEMEKVCTHVAILRKGTLIRAGEISAVLQDHQNLENAFVHLTLQ